MLKSVVLFLCALFALNFSGLSQDLQCGQVSMTEKMHALYPEYKELGEQAFELATKAMEEGDFRSSTKADPFIVPVVFHVMYYGNQGNISDAQLHSAIDHLNATYRKEIEADNNAIIPEFQGIHADMEIEFRLATLDPSGNCHSGINRYEDVRTFQGNDEVKAGRQWPAEQYLNVYTVRGMESQGVAGYAYLPGTAPASIDGIVILSNFTGTIGTSNLSRANTLVHEVGHYLGLPHTWGGTNTPGVAVNCSDDDGVADTPNTIGSRNCNYNFLACDGESRSNVQNFMCYAGCPNEMFTLGQRSRCYGNIQQNVSGRGNLVSNANLAEVGADYARDAYPTHLCDVDFERVLDVEQEACLGVPIQFNDESLYDIVSWDWSFPGGNPSTSNEKNPTVVYDQTGYYDVTLTVTNSSGETDTRQKREYVIIEEHPQLEFPIAEEFNDGGIFDIYPFGWYTLENPQNDAFFEIANVGYLDGQSAACYLNSTNSETYDAFASMGIELPSNTGIEFSFYYAHAYTVGQRDADIMTVEISTDCGRTWTQLATLTDEELNTVTGEEDDFFVPSGQSEWKQKVLDISDYAGETVRLKIGYNHDGGNNVYVDRFMMSETVGIAERNNFEASLSPNPVHGGSTLKVIASEAITNAELVSTSGQIFAVEIERKNGENYTLRVPNIANGYYVLNLLSNNGQVSEPVIIK